MRSSAFEIGHVTKNTCKDTWRDSWRILARYKGRLLAADESPEVLEGEWNRDKVVLLSFDDAESFRAWFASEDYQAISKDRVAATEGPILLLRGVG